MDLSVIEGMEGSEFNCGVSPGFSKLRFQVDTLRGVLSAIDRYTQWYSPYNIGKIGTCLNVVIICTMYYLVH